jgi:hypothetical protein
MFYNGPHERSINKFQNTEKCVLLSEENAGKEGGMWNRPPPLEIRTWWRASPSMLKWSYRLKCATLNASLELARSASFFSSSSFPSLGCFELSQRACACLRTMVLHKRGDRPQHGTCFAQKTATGDKGDHFYTVWVKKKGSEGLSHIDRTGRLRVPIHNYYWYQ